ncbi:MAG: peroxidase [Catenulispora sp. 13_1_20CM_3_70_7]|nr:MAG: peroxidase [Catenulispora sp. 13_1_20CM_3_70_7]
MASAPSAARPRAAHPARDLCLAPGRTIDAPVTEGGRYGRMFPDLPAASFDDDRLLALGMAGGVCDGGACDADSHVEAGQPFFGQYLAHDITADRSPLRTHADIDGLRNVRSPRANLEALYGGGPVGSPYLFDQDDPAKLLLAIGGRDLPRNQQGIALIGDPRNDVHAFMTGLQLAFIRAHNHLVDRLRGDGVAESDLFEDARLALVWHYQWVILHDFLPTLVGPELTTSVLNNGPRFYRPHGEPFIPVEFADAAYRYGHSQIKADYQLQEGGRRFPVFPDLAGFRPLAAEHSVDWRLLFDVPGQLPAQRAKPIDGQLPASLLRLPESITGTVDIDAYRSLAARDLQRGEGTGLPSGEAVARAVGAKPLTRLQLALGDWQDETPLWLYIQREATIQSEGDRLGEVGGRIVAEVVVGIIRNDPESYLSSNPDWQPTLPSHQAGTFKIRDLLILAR